MSLFQTADAISSYRSIISRGARCLIVSAMIWLCQGLREPAFAPSSASSSTISFSRICLVARSIRSPQAVDFTAAPSGDAIFAAMSGTSFPTALAAVALAPFATNCSATSLPRPDTFTTFPANPIPVHVSGSSAISKARFFHEDADQPSSSKPIRL